MANAVNGNDFFEGTEKLLEVWFGSTTDAKTADLRNIDRSFWESLLEKVNCQIISCKSIDGLDAYVLSESSMFISRNRFILKTCGRTTLLHAVDSLLKQAKEELGFDTIADVFYSRKNFLRPELQPQIHQTFEDEVTHLDEIFDDGAAYALGRLNADCWYLYTLDIVGVEEPDQTIELLMSDLDPEIMSIFTIEKCKTGAEATKMSGIDKLIPGAIIDDFQFDPCGYSMNGLLPETKYFTIHITPEEGFSYVSFESNVEQKCYQQLLNMLIDTFKPGKVLATLFANNTSYASDSLKLFERDEPLPNFKCSDRQFCRFKNYNLVYAHFKKNG
ncbi:S-adenosylmethionine decarboxylase proenzyme-like [Tubulanus polymorphus]|uniref:S-adenosylmethionine decarboxylase proenzyme-like n=1 Tax=Tubulanus polymorphus TaxID=672921 RepID=UPI003DA6BF16